MEYIICMLIGVIIGLVIAPITVIIKHDNPVKETETYELSEADKKFLEEQQQMIDAARDIQRMFVGDDDDAE